MPAATAGAATEDVHVNILSDMQEHATAGSSLATKTEEEKKKKRDEKCQYGINSCVLTVQHVLRLFSRPVCLFIVELSPLFHHRLIEERERDAEHQPRASDNVDKKV